MNYRTFRQNPPFLSMLAAASSDNAGMAHRDPNAGADFTQAVQAGNFDAADRFLPSLNGRRNTALSQAVSELHIARHRWTEAAEELGRVSAPDAKLRRNLCLNLAALKTHRPAIYRVALDALETNTNKYLPFQMSDGTFSVAKMAAGRAAPLIADPAGHLRQAAEQLKAVNEQGKAIAVLSIADGSLLTWLAANGPKLFLGREQSVYLIEPDAGLLLASLLANDFTGPAGAIEQDRILWYAGAKWGEAFRLDLLTDRCLVFPQVNVTQGAAAREIEQTLINVLGEIGKLDAAAELDLKHYYGNRTAADHAGALAGRAGRAPRVLLLTTLFSTVLQHSSRDAEDGFRRLGCDTFLMIEPTPHHGLTRSAMRRALAEFKPDLVFQIDHNRFEHSDLFPPGLPFVNWIQDLLPHLMTPSAGRQLGAADFVLTPSLQRWVDDFAYPQRQCLEFRKLTRVPPRPPARHSDGDRVVYVSNWSQRPQQIVDELLAGMNAPTHAAIAEACRRMIAIYEAGESLPSAGDVRVVLTKVMADIGVTGDEAFIRNTTTRLADRLNNLLYRHQGLKWAADACKTLGLRLEIYGNGWDSHPTFAKHARGNVGYGAPLEELTRSAGVNLILEPFMCMTHQRLLDALAAGGFCLVRDQSANHTANEWIDLLSRAGPDVQNSQSLKRSLHGQELLRFEANYAECERLDVSPKQIDHVAAVCRLQNSGFFPTTGQVLPLLDRIAFSTTGDLARLLMRASRDPEYRANVATAQRRHIEQRYSYQAGIARVLKFVGARLAEQPTLAARAA